MQYVHILPPELPQSNFPACGLGICWQLLLRRDRSGHLSKSRQHGLEIYPQYTRNAGHSPRLHPVISFQDPGVTLLPPGAWSRCRSRGGGFISSHEIQKNLILSHWTSSAVLTMSMEDLQMTRYLHHQ
jgi:hypothetical protein